MARRRSRFFIVLHVVYGGIIGGWMHAAPLATRYLNSVTGRYQGRARGGVAAGL